MQEIFFTELEKLASDDFNNAQLAVYQCLQDQVIYAALGKPSQGCVGSSFIASYTSALAASLASGVGFYYNSANTGFTPKFSMIYSASAIPVTFTAASSVHDRIDLVCLAPNFAVTSTASRYVKTGGTGPVVLTTVNKVQQDGYTLQVVAGTPASSPSAPSLPSGYIPIAQAYIHQSVGLTGSGDITDERNIVSFVSAVSNAGHTVATSTSLQGQLDELDANAGTTNTSVAAINTALAGFIVKKTVHASSGTYTPTTGMIYCEVEAIGAGGGSGGVASLASQASSAGGGGGEYLKKGFTAATIGSSKVYTCGSGGTAGANTGGNGGTGGNSTFGTTLLVAAGGTGGGGCGVLPSNGSAFGLQGSGGSGNTGDIEVPGQDGGAGLTAYWASVSPVVAFAVPGAGGASGFGPGRAWFGSGTGTTPVGAGAPGVFAAISTATAGLVGDSGAIIITEYILP